MKHHNFTHTQVNILNRAQGLVGCGVLAHSFQTADNTPTFFSDVSWFSDHSDTQLTENEVCNKEKTLFSCVANECIIYYRDWE